MPIEGLGWEYPCKCISPTLPNPAQPSSARRLHICWWGQQSLPIAVTWGWWMLWPQRFSLWFPPLQSSDPDSLCPSHSPSLISPSVIFLLAVFSDYVILRNRLLATPSPNTFLSLSHSPTFLPLRFGPRGKFWAGLGLYKESGVISVICSTWPWVVSGSKRFLTEANNSHYS